MRLLIPLARLAMICSLMFSLILSLFLLPDADCNAGVLISDVWFNDNETIITLYERQYYRLNSDGTLQQLTQFPPSR
jgi:hypothetical protein